MEELMTSRTRRHALLAVTLAVLALTACDEAGRITDPAAPRGVPARADDPFVAQLSQIGFDVRGAMDYGSYFVVEQDITITKEQLSRWPTTNDAWDRLSPRQWRTNVIVGQPQVQSIVVDLTALASYPDWLSATRLAMDAWSSLNGAGVRMTEGSPGDITVIVDYSIGSNNAALASWPGAGAVNEPGPTIRVNPGFLPTPNNASTKLRNMVHELGHTVGFRHTNWQYNPCINRSEGPGTEGANQIPGTPPTDGASVMNGCTATEGWNGFSGADVTAIRTLYPGILVTVKKPTNARLSITAAGDYTWTSTVSGGNGSYSYVWERDYYNTGTWSQVGYSPTLTQTITCWDNDTYVALRLKVTSDGLTNMGEGDDLYVNIPQTCW